MKFFTNYKYEAGNSHLANDFKKVLTDHKVVYFEPLPEPLNPDQFFSQLSHDVGQFVKRDENFKDGAQTSNQEWLDISFKEELKKETFRHSDTRQPLHTDGAYTSYEFEISFFYCKVQAEVGGATTFFDSDELCRLLAKFQSNLFERLLSTEVIFDKGDTQKRVAKIISKDSLGWLMNWNFYRISAKNPKSTVEMCHEFHDFLENKIVAGGLPTACKLEPRSAVFFRDSRILHGRNAFFGDRVLMKGGINL